MSAFPNFSVIAWNFGDMTLLREALERTLTLPGVNNVVNNVASHTCRRVRSREAGCRASTSARGADTINEPA